MTEDMFETKEHKLERYCRSKGFFSKADLMRYGLDYFYLRAWRTVCSWVTEGKARKLPADECIFRGLTGKMAWYEWLGPAEDDHAEVRRNNLLGETQANLQAAGR